MLCRSISSYLWYDHKQVILLLSLINVHWLWLPLGLVDVWHKVRAMMLSHTKEVIALLRSSEGEELRSLIERYKADSRIQIQKAVMVARRRLQKEEQEQKRVRTLYESMYELSWQHAHKSVEDRPCIVGIDEVGRGALAGPLTVAAVVLKPDPIIWGINDSKQLSQEKRELLALQIRRHAQAYALYSVDPQDIDAAGISASLRYAMLQLLSMLELEPDLVLIDGNPMKIHEKECAVISGDARLACVAAASIIAKVHRDQYMRELELECPGYFFAKSKGYGSLEHRQAIAERGLSPHHRKSYCSHMFTQDSLF